MKWLWGIIINEYTEDVLGKVRCKVMDLAMLFQVSNFRYQHVFQIILLVMDVVI